MCSSDELKELAPSCLVLAVEAVQRHAPDAALEPEPLRLEEAMPMATDVEDLPAEVATPEAEAARFDSVRP